MSAALQQPSREDFAALLEQSDPDLWDWLTGKASPDPRFAALIDEIRSHHRA